MVTAPRFPGEPVVPKPNVTPRCPGGGRGCGAALSCQLGLGLCTPPRTAAAVSPLVPPPLDVTLRPPPHRTRAPQPAGVRSTELELPGHGGGWGGGTPRSRRCLIPPYPLVLLCWSIALLLPAPTQAGDGTGGDATALAKSPHPGSQNPSRAIEVMRGNASSGEQN